MSEKKQKEIKFTVTLKPTPATTAQTEGARQFGEIVYSLAIDLNKLKKERTK